MRLKNGEIVTIKTTQVNDAQALLDFFNASLYESDSLTTAPGELNLTLEMEERLVQGWIDNKNCNNLICLHEGEIIGICGLHGKDNRKRLGHITNLGITVSKSYWGLGVGYLLIQEQINYAKRVGLKKLDLEVRTDNLGAVHLYKKCGFEIEGTHKMAALIDGEYKDNYFMGLIIDL